MNKKIVLLLFVVAAVAFGGACVFLIGQVRSMRAREQAAAAVAQAETAASAFQEDRIKSVERDRVRVQKQNEDLSELARNLRASEARQASNAVALAQRLKATSTNGGIATETDAGFGGKGMGDMMGKMMKDPAMREMIRSQQKTMMKSMYGSLFKDLNLPADQQKKLTDLLLDAQMAGVEGAGDMFGGETGARTNAIAAIAEKQKSNQEQVKALLGEEKFKQYEEYQSSLGDRMVLNQFQQQNEDSETALRDDQMKRLVAMMKEERTKTPPIISEDPAKSAESLTQILDNAALDRQFAWQEDHNRRVLERAGEVLSAEQLKEFADFQKAQMEMQKLGLKMAREMFGGAKEAPPGNVPVIVLPEIR